MTLLNWINPVSFPLLAGTLAALAHVLSGPDHLAAVMPLAVENNKKSWKIGLGWGLGHITGMLSIGLLFLAFKQWLPVDKISAHSEALVGIVLIFIGLWAFYRIFKPQKHHQHLHIHQEGEPYIHSHHHDHEHEEGHGHHHDKQGRSGVLSAYLVGTLHSLAGISHFLVFIPALGLKTTAQSVWYLTGFGIGTILAMTAFALVIGKTAEKSETGHNSMFFKGLRLAAGSFAIGTGIFWLVAGI